MSAFKKVNVAREKNQLFRLDPRSGDDGCDVIRPIPKLGGVALHINNYIEAGTVYASSDEILKSEVEDIPANVLEKMAMLAPKQYKLKCSNDQEKMHYGLIAQEVESIMPNLIITNGANKAVNYLEIIPLLLLKIKELENEIKQFKNK